MKQYGTVKASDLRLQIIAQKYSGATKHTLPRHSSTRSQQSNRATLLCLPFCQYTLVCIRESTKPSLCSKWGHFDSAKPIPKILVASWTFGTVEKKFRSLNTENLGSVGQRTAKLLTIKFCACALFGLYGRRVCKHKVWWLVTLQPFYLQTPNFLD